MYVLGREPKVFLTKLHFIYRYPGYSHNGKQLQELKISLPLSIISFVELLSAEKTGLANNFVSAFIAHAASAVVFHSEAIKELQDDCPIILCFSKYSGTGRYVICYAMKPCM